MKIIPSILAALLTLLIVPQLHAQTQVQGTIDGATWTMAGSPYVLVGDLQAANLTIEQGVRIEASGSYEILVTGQVTAVGTGDAPITFTTAGAVPTWGGIRFVSVTTLHSTFRYCHIEHASSCGLDLVNSAPPTIDHCTFSENSGPSGGAIHVANTTLVGSTLNITNCAFVNNSSTTDGGGLAVTLAGGTLSIEASQFSSNIANPGLASGNYVGGAIFLASGDANLWACTFTNNFANARCSATFDCGVLARGGAIYVGTPGAVSIASCTFQGNESVATNNGNCFFGGQSLSYGAAVFVGAGAVTLSNDLFYNNTTPRTACGPADGGSAVYVSAGSALLTNCTIVDNPDATGIERAGGSLTAENTIVFFNDAGSAQVGGACTLRYCDIQHGYSGTGNLDANPSFVGGDYALSSLSPCIDTGNPAYDVLDRAFPPSRGTLRNDMGYTGGPGAMDLELPQIAVADVAGDQGGMVKVSWSAFPGDSPGALQPITSYEVQRAPDPFVAPVTQWTEVTTVAATHAAAYTANVPTALTHVVDQSWPYYVYRVVGVTALPGEDVPSNSSIGMAVDNIAPPAPALSIFDNQSQRTVATMPLDLTGVPDFQEVCLYRGWQGGMSAFGRDTTAVLWDTAVDCADGITPVGGCTTSSGLHVWCENYRHLFYYVGKTKDVHGNLSAVSNRVTGRYPTDAIPARVPLRVAITGIHPNPFNPSTSIEFELPAQGVGSLRIYSTDGRLVRELVNAVLPPGRHEVNWDGRDTLGRTVGSGVYHCRLTTPSGSAIANLMLLK